MTKLLDRAIDKARTLPVEMQDDIARMVLLFAGEEQLLVILTPEEDAALDVSDAAAARGEFATDDEVQAIWAKHGL